MKILQLVPELNQGGVERGVVEFSREIVKRGHESFVISAGGRMVEQIVNEGGEHITLDVCSKNPLTAAVRAGKLRRIIKQVQPDIVHPRSRIPAWLTVFAMRKMDVPMVTTVHGFNSVNFYSNVMTRGERVICVSSAVKKYIMQNYNTPDEKIRIVHRGVDPDEFDNNIDCKFIADFKNRFGLDGKFVVGCVGRISPLKNFESFIKAIVQCRKKIPNIKGVIVGDARRDKADYFQQLKGLADELKAQDLIEFVGSQQKMPEIYSVLDLVVSCSRKPESFGRTLVEAMAMGTPAIAPALGGPIDIIHDGRTGILIDDVEPEKIADGILKATKLKFENLREYAIDNFGIDKMVENELGVYSEVVGG